MGSSTSSTEPIGAREASKVHRRNRILDAAKTIIRELGHESLSIRSLAVSAGVSTPTIYNLVGSKHDILLALADDLMSQLERAHHVREISNPIEQVEEVINQTIAVFDADEHYSRQLHLGLEAESLDRFEQSLRTRGRQVALDDCRRALQLKYLRGDIDPELLGNRFADGFQNAQRAWLRGELNLEGVRREALTSCFIILAADAVTKFRTRLIEAIRALNDS